MLLEAGKRVRIVKRSASPMPPGAEVVHGDAAHRALCIKAAAGAAAVYHCMNPSYYARIWAELVPRYMENLIAAAGHTAARLVVLDNVYMLGRPEGRALDEDSPVNPCSRKGEIRARAAEQLFEAHRRCDVLATSGRASDYYGPGGTLTHLGDYFWPAALAGKKARVLVDPDAVHTYHYIPDVAAGLLTLGCAETVAYGRAWMLPCAPTETMRDLVSRFSASLGRDIRLAAVRRWMVKAIGLGVPFLREVGEMLYQWDEPFVIDDCRFRERFGVEPTKLDAAAIVTVEWAKRHYTGKTGRREAMPRV
jgi:nucleoside-diphosphate-sugar epimerase